MGDLKDSRLIYLKGFLFLLMIIISAAGLLIDSFNWKTAILITILAWASARFYYFLFYVIEKYVDPEYKFAGIFGAIKYLLGKK